MRNHSGLRSGRFLFGGLQTMGAVLVLCALLVAGCRKPQQVELTVSVAASLTGTIEQAESAYSRLHPEVTFRNNFGSSGALARQIEEGAPVDLILSAGAKPVDQLVTKKLVRAADNRVLLGNQLVLIAPANSALASLQQLDSAAVRKIALGDPLSVPAGIYAQQTLKAAKLYDVLDPKLVFAKDVRQVLAYVESGNVEAGFVYATDARQNSKVRVVETVADNTHEPIVYPIAVIAQSAHAKAAQAFSDFLFTSEATSVFTAKGFTAAGR